MLAESDGEEDLKEVFYRDFLIPATVILSTSRRGSPVELTPENLHLHVNERYHGPFFRFNVDGIVNLLTYLQVTNVILADDKSSSVGDIFCFC